MSWRTRALELFPRLESVVRRSRIGQSEVYERALLQVYFTYKKWVEDDLRRILQVEVGLLRRGHVLDVGGGLGYSTRLFAEGLDPGFEVHVFEPAPDNAREVRGTIARFGLADRVRLFDVAVGSWTGSGHLSLNAEHRTDHRLAPDGGFEVRVTRLDDHLTAHGLAHAPIALVKVDVQGGEPDVIDGLGTRRCPVLLEYHPPSLAASGHDPRAFLTRLRTEGTLWWHGGGRREMATDAVLTRAISRRGYVDLLWRRT